MSPNSEGVPSPSQVAERGQKIYEGLRKELETESNRGKFVVIDIESGGHVIADSLVEALDEARQKYPGKVFHTVRIGFPGVFKMGTYASKGYFYGLDSH